MPKVEHHSSFRSFQRAWRRLKARHADDEKDSFGQMRDVRSCLNPHYGYRKTTAAYAEAVNRSPEDIVPLLEHAMRTVLEPGLLTVERISLYLTEHWTQHHLDGTAVILWSYLGVLFPQLKTLHQVRKAVYELIPLSKFQTLPISKRERFLPWERRIDKRRDDRRTSFSKEDEAYSALSLRLATKLVGLDEQTLLARSQLSDAAREVEEKDFSVEVEYIGWMNLLATAESSILREKRVPFLRPLSPREYPRRCHSRYRWELLLDMCQRDVEGEEEQQSRTSSTSVVKARL